MLDVLPRHESSGWLARLELSCDGRTFNMTCKASRRRRRFSRSDELSFSVRVDRRGRVWYAVKQTGNEILNKQY